MKVKMLFCNEKGEIFDHPSLLLMGDRGGGAELIPFDELIEIPRGSDIMVLPQRIPVGWNEKKKSSEPLYESNHMKTYAAAAFLAPTFTQSYRSVYIKNNDNAVDLPLFAYTPVGYAKGKYYVPCVKVDHHPRQNPWLFDEKIIKDSVKTRLNQIPDNSVIKQLQICALTYHCRAAQNYFLNRWEAPIPTSLSCNARCTGCISLQPKGTEFKAAHDRLTLAPKVEDIAQLALGHIERVGPKAIVSFGQGCEGEPLLMGDVLIESIKLIRKKTKLGWINLNTNGSKPDIVEKMCQVGLNSIRVSLNSAQEELYNAYYHPYQYQISDIFKSIEILNHYNGHSSINLLFFPGLTDQIDELNQIKKLIRTSHLKMIQMRNLNIDPDIYIDSLPEGVLRKGMGVKNWIKSLKEEFPELMFGYYNPEPYHI